MIYKRNPNTGKIHRLDDEGRSFEGDNLDDAEDLVDLEESEALRAVADDPEALCQNCWPVGERETHA